MDRNSNLVSALRQPPEEGAGSWSGEAGSWSGEAGTPIGPKTHPGCSPQVATDKDNGILLYKGDNDPLALELYQGHVRLVYDSPSSPPTTVYR